MTPAHAAPAMHWTAINMGSVAASVAAPAAAAATSAAPPITRAGVQRLAASESGTRPMLKPIQNSGERVGIRSGGARRR